MKDQPIPAAIIGERSTYARRNWVLSPKGCAPCVLANWGIKSPPPLLLVEEIVGLEIRDGLTHRTAYEGDGVKLPTGTASCSRVREKIAPTIMAGPVVGVVVRA